MSQLDANGAAQLGSQLTGIPEAIVRALIAAEGSLGSGDWVNGSIRNNPFDVTAQWADLAGYTGSVTSRTGGSQGNIASFVDTEAAVRAWAQGINTFSNYAGLRADLASGAGANVLTTDLARAGYAGPGNVSGWVANVLAFVGRTLSQPKGQAPTIPAVTQASSQAAQAVSSAVTAPVQGVSNSLGGIASSIAGIGQAVSQAVNNEVAFVNWLGQPGLWGRLAAGFVGVLLLLVGLVLFALSFAPHQVQQMVPVAGQVARLAA